MKVVVSSFIYRKCPEGYEFLLLKRIKEKGGFWQPPSGLQEEGESLLDCAFREILEESFIPREQILNIIEPFYTFEMHKDYLSGKPISPIKSYFFAFEVNSEVLVKLENNHCNEHEEFVWKDYSGSIALLKWDDNKEALKKLFKIIS
jgi:dihydroneopterin triphosphate diphosphatase